MTKHISGTEVVVNRKAKNGFYVYTSDALPGLYVASRDDQRAYDDVLESIRQLYHLDFGMDVEVVHIVSHEEFIARMPAGERAREIMHDRTADLMADDGVLTFAVTRMGAAAHI
ncbi:hypothetical protein SAMN02990966_05948 [Rhodospirillales bacterium URHD0017]|nr:hypothetical protein SAMN02990966_05948 [Rhodospirillales bacterium URHD0017]